MESVVEFSPGRRSYLLILKILKVKFDAEGQLGENMRLSEMQFKTLKEVKHVVAIAFASSVS